jgi:hypothetical protein
MGGTAYIDRKHAELRLDGQAIAVLTRASISARGLKHQYAGR